MTGPSSIVHTEYSYCTGTPSSGLAQFGKISSRFHRVATGKRPRTEAESPSLRLTDSLLSNQILTGIHHSRSLSSTDSPTENHKACCSLSHSMVKRWVFTDSISISAGQNRPKLPDPVRTGSICTSSTSKLIQYLLYSVQFLIP